MTTTFTEQQVEMADRFTERMEAALKETELPPETWSAFILGWLYGQLRQSFSKEQVRNLFYATVQECERRLDDVGEA